MKRILLAMMVMATALSIGGCASTFVAVKDGKGYYLGSGSNAAYKMFCESGDLKKILSGTTTLAETMKHDLYRYNCDAERSNEKIKQVYASMSPDQRKDLRRSFKNNGYEINAMRC